MAQFTPPQTDLEKELVRIWERVLQRTPIGIHSNFFELGGTSLDALRIFNKIEEMFHKRLPLSMILGSPTIHQLAASLIPGRSLDQKAHAVPIQSAGEKPNFFCIGGGVIWHAVSEHLGIDQPMLNVALDPGAATRLKGPNVTEKLARDMASALCEKQPQGPYYLGGFCCDAVFAYEIARQLMMYGHEVGLLALVEPFTPVQGVASRLMMAAKRILFRTGFRLRELSSLGVSQFPQYARSRWNGLKTMAREANWRKSARARARKRQSASLDMDQIVFVASSTYQPKPLSCPTVIFHCKDWPMLSAGDPYFGWRKYLTGRSTTVEVPGDHIGIFHDPSVGVLAEKLKACLAGTDRAEKLEFDLVLESDRKLYLDQSRA